MPVLLADLPRELLELVYPHLDIPFALRSTCCALRDAFTEELVALFGERIRGKALGRRETPPKTKTAMVDVVKDVRLIAWACENDCHWTHLLAIAASATGHEESLNYLREFRGLAMDAAYPAWAAANGHLATLSWLCSHGVRRLWDKHTCDMAAAGGHLRCLEFAFNRNCPFSNAGLNAAARNGHYVCVEFMLMQNAMDFRWDRSRCMACDYAASGGHIRVLQLLKEFRVPWRMSTADECAKAGHVDCLEFLAQEACPIDYTTCFHNAACAGHVEMLRWIMARWTPTYPYFHEAMLEDVASKGAIPVLELAKECGVDFDHFVCLVPYAALFGHLQCAKWLANEGAPLNPESLPMMAAEGGHIEVLNWVAELPDMFWGNDTYEGAINEGHVHVLEWAYNTKKLDGPWGNDDLARRVARRDNMAMAKWVVDNGFVWGEIATRTNRKMAEELAKYIEADTPST
jgi:hypothetical protein